MNTKLNCPACKSEMVFLVHKIEKLPAILFPVDPVESHEVPLRAIEIYECEKCRHLFQSNWDDLFIRLIYDKWYLYYPFLNLESMNDSYRKPFEIFASRLLKKFIKYKNISLLEIGCGDEAQLEIFLKHGLNVTSINPTIPSSEKVRFIQGYYGTTVISEKFDIIVSRFSLEHITDVSSFFSELQNNLKEGGSVIIQIPNAQQFAQSGLLNIFAHEHIHYFNPSSLIAMATTYGFLVPQIYDVNGPSLIVELVKKEFNRARKYIDQSTRTANEVVSLVDQAKKKVLIYGAGLSLTKMLYEAGLLRLQEKLLIVDDNETIDGKTMPGLNIQIQSFSSVKLEDVSDIILALNPIYQKNVLEKINSQAKDINVFRVDSNGLSKI